MSQRALIRAAILSLVIGVALMIPFEATATRIVGVLGLFGFIVFGIFGVAHPDYLGADEDWEPDAGD